MATYIYLNTYTNGYLYVGSHTWNGPVGEIDPSYKGSSTVAISNKFTVSNIQILSLDPEDKFLEEKHWINHYCDIYGIAPQAKYAAHLRNNYWVDQFKDGLVLNTHCNDCSHMLDICHGSAARAKMVHTRRKNGTLTPTWTFTPEALQKRHLTRLRNPQKLSSSGLQKMMDGKRVNARKCVLYNEVRVWAEVCRELGIPHGSDPYFFKKLMSIGKLEVNNVTIYPYGNI